MAGGRASPEGAKQEAERNGVRQSTRFPKLNSAVTAL